MTCEPVDQTCPDCGSTFTIRSCLFNAEFEAPAIWRCVPCGSRIVLGAAKSGDYSMARGTAYAESNVHHETCTERGAQRAGGSDEACHQRTS